MQHVTTLKKGKLVLNIKPRSDVESHNYENLNQFINDFTSLFLRLDSLLGLESFYNSNKKSVLSKRLKKVIELFNKADNTCKHEFCALDFFTADLEKIKESSNEIFTKFRREIIRQKSSQSWQGIRFEIHVAASLFYKNIEYIKQESPDFRIKEPFKTCRIESTSARLENNKGESHFYKIESSIHSKSKKPYANKDTALFIDTTNIMYNEAMIEKKGEFEDLVSSIRENEKVKYGSVIIFTFRMNYDLGRYESLWRRIDTEGCSNQLKEFLDKIYPDNGFVSVPKEFEFVHSA